LYYTRTIIIDYDHKKHCVDNEYYYNLGIKYLNKEDYKLAKSNFKNALKRSPYDLGSIYNIGVCCLKLLMVDKAKEYFIQAAKLGDEASIKMLNKFESNNY